MVVENTEVAQVEVPVVSASVEDSTIQTSSGVSSAVEFAAASVTVEATTTTIPEVSATTSVSIEPAAVFVSAPGELASVFVENTCTIMERGSGNASTMLSPTMSIMKELAQQMVQQFFASMKSCIELALSGGSSFEFVRMLLENQIENIRHTGIP